MTEPIPTPGQQAHDAWRAKLDAVEAERDKAYEERAALVAYLSAAYPSEITPAESDSGAWNLVFVATPVGQMSWHLHEDDVVEYFQHLVNLPETGVTWDGHTTEKKYERLRGLTAMVAALRQPQPAPALAAMAETRKMRDIVCHLLDLFGAPDDRLMQHADVTRATLQRYAAEAGVRLDGREKP
jgi:hypothetical protein